MSRRKGNERERQARKIYESAGFKTEKAVDERWGSTDLFGQFDHLAVRPDAIHFVQVKPKSAEGVGDMERWVAENGYENATHEFAVYHSGEGWRLVRVGADGHETVYDEREDDRVGTNQHTPLNIGEGLAEFLSRTED